MRKYKKYLLAAGMTLFFTVSLTPNIMSVDAATKKTDTFDLKNFDPKDYPVQDEIHVSDWLKKANQTRVKSNKKKASNLPTKYDLRDDGYVTPIKNQGSFPTCWAFGTIGALESNLLKQNKNSKAGAGLSEHHLSWFAQEP